MTKKFAIVLALFVISIVCCAGCIGPGDNEEPEIPDVPDVPDVPVTPVDPVDPVVPTEEYSVMFMLNYGDAGAYTAETVKAGETVSKPATPTRSGYTFKGWFTAAEGGAEYDFTQAVTADVTLYAQWKKVSSSSSGSGSSGGSSTPSTPSQTTPEATIGGQGYASIEDAITGASTGATITLVTAPSDPIAVGEKEVTIDISGVDTTTPVSLTYAENTKIQIKADSPDDVTVTIIDTDEGTEKKVYFEDDTVGGLLVPAVAVDTTKNVGDAYTASGLQDLVTFINSDNSGIFDAPVEDAPSEHVQEGWTVLFYEPAPTALGNAPASESGDASGWTITLKGNIDLTDTEWTPLGTADKAFSGTIDGKGFTITNLTGGTDKGSETPFGLIAYGTGDVTVQNLKMENVNINSGEYASAIMGLYIGKAGDNAATYDVLFENIDVSGSISGTDKPGAILGCTYSSAYPGTNKTITFTFKDCVNNAEISGTDRVGGIAGAVAGEFLADGNKNKISVIFNNCTNNGDITTTHTNYKTGGIAGFLGSNGNYVFSQCSSGEDVSVDGKLFGQYYVNMNTWPPSGSTSFKYMGTPLPFGNLTFTPSSLTIYDGGAFKKLIVGWEYLHDPDQNYYHAFNGIYWVCTSPLGEDEWRLTIENEHYRVPNSYTPVDDESDTDLKPDIHHNNNPYPTAETWNREGYTLVTSGDTYTYYKGTVRGY